MLCGLAGSCDPTFFFFLATTLPLPQYNGAMAYTEIMLLMLCVVRCATGECYSPDIIFSFSSSGVHAAVSNSGHDVAVCATKPLAGIGVSETGGLDGSFGTNFAAVLPSSRFGSGAVPLVLSSPDPCVGIAASIMQRVVVLRDTGFHPTVHVYHLTGQSITWGSIPEINSADLPGVEVHFTKSGGDVFHVWTKGANSLIVFYKAEDMTKVGHLDGKGVKGVQYSSGAVYILYSSFYEKRLVSLSMEGPPVYRVDTPEATNTVLTYAGRGDYIVVAATTYSMYNEGVLKSSTPTPLRGQYVSGGIMGIDGVCPYLKEDGSVVLTSVDDTGLVADICGHQAASVSFGGMSRNMVFVAKGREEFWLMVVPSTLTPKVFLTTLAPPTKSPTAAPTSMPTVVPKGCTAPHPVHASINASRSTAMSHDAIAACEGGKGESVLVWYPRSPQGSPTEDVTSYDSLGSCSLVGFAPDGSLAVVFEVERRVYTLAVGSSASSLVEVAEVPCSVYVVGVHTDGRFVIVSCSDKMVVFDANYSYKTVLEETMFPQKWHFSTSLSSDSKLFGIANETDVYIWQLYTRESGPLKPVLSAVIKGYNTPIFAFSSTDPDEIAVATSTGIEILYVASLRAKFFIDCSRPSYLEYLPRGGFLVAVDFDATKLTFWNTFFVASHTIDFCVPYVSTESQIVRVFSGEGDTLIVSGDDGWTALNLSYLYPIPLMRIKTEEIKQSIAPTTPLPPTQPPVTELPSLAPVESTNTPKVDVVVTAVPVVPNVYSHAPVVDRVDGSESGGDGGGVDTVYVFIIVGVLLCLAGASLPFAIIFCRRSHENDPLSSHLSEELKERPIEEEDFCVIE